MNAMVSARVPVELRDQVARKLKKSGHTTTMLINAAYEEYARTGMLPGAEKPSAVQAQSGKRALSPAQRERLVRSVRASTIDVDQRLVPEDYKAMLREGKWADYEALA